MTEDHKRFINEPVMPYGPQNPHPNYGKDSNIMNVYGHTHYPKWIDINGKQVLVESEKHEKALLPGGSTGGNKSDPSLKKAKDTGWTE